MVTGRGGDRGGDEKSTASPPQAGLIKWDLATCILLQLFLITIVLKPAATEGSRGDDVMFYTLLGLLAVPLFLSSRNSYLGAKNNDRSSLMRSSIFLALRNFVPSVQYERAKRVSGAERSGAERMSRASEQSEREQEREREQKRMLALN